MIKLQIPLYDSMWAGTVFLLMLVALLLMKAVVLRQLRIRSEKGRLQFLSYPEQLVKSTCLPFMLGIALLKRFRDYGIAFSYPTRTLYVAPAVAQDSNSDDIRDLRKTGTRAN